MIDITFFGVGSLLGIFTPYTVIQLFKSRQLKKQTYLLKQIAECTKQEDIVPIYKTLFSFCYEFSKIQKSCFDQVDLAYQCLEKDEFYNLYQDKFLVSKCPILAKPYLYSKLFKLKKDMFLMIFQYSSVFKKATSILKANQMKCVNLKVLSLKDFYPKKDEFRFKNWQEQYCNSADSLATFSVSINSVAQFLCDQLEDLFLKKQPK